MNTWLFKTQRCAGPHIGEIPLWQGLISVRGTASLEEVAAIVAESTRQTVSDVVYTITKTGEAVYRLLRSGKNVNLDWVAFLIALDGSFDRLDSAFDPSRNSLVARAHSRPFLRDCLKDIVPINVTSGLKATIQSVIDKAAKVEGVISTLQAYVAGLNILVGDAPDEGVWLLAKNGSAVCTPRIVANTATTLDLEFSELPEDGEYTLMVKARSGASTDYAPATARRNITVRRNA